jgi:Domain of unknown function (DUF4375)
LATNILPISICFERYEAGSMSISDFDYELWLYFMNGRAVSVACFKDITHLPISVQHYLASRYMEWEVDNGTFSQAAYNIPDWFEPAAAGYDAIGVPKAAAIIREARRILLAGASDFSKDKNVSIGELFQEFEMSPLGRLDWTAKDIGWNAETKRIEYVLKHKDDFLTCVATERARGKAGESE